MLISVKTAVFVAEVLHFHASVLNVLSYMVINVTPKLVFFLNKQFDRK